MPARKRTVKSKPENQIETPTLPDTPEEKKGLGKLVFLLAALIILGFLIYQNRSLFVVALVDNKPIWRPSFESRMLSQVGQKTLDDMVNEQIILNEASKKGISITPQEVDTKISEITKTLPEGTNLDQALQSQGMTMEDLRRQLTLQLTIEKMMSSEIKVSEAEISKFLEENKEFLTATDEAGLRAEATQAIQNEKRNTQFQKLFADLQKKAKVTKFL